MSAALASASAAEGAGGLQLLTGPQRVAALLMLMDEEDGKAVLGELNDGEIRQVCLAMGEIGSLRNDTIAALVDDFVIECGGTSAISGSLGRAQEMLSRAFPPERVSAIMAEVRGVDAGRQIWRRLGEIPAPLLATFLRDEYPQTIAVVVSKLGAEQGGRILALLPEDVAVDVIDRTLGMGPPRAEAVEPIEEMLYREFLLNGPPRTRRDAFEVMAERFDSVDKATEARFFAGLERVNKDAAERVRAKMMTFEELAKLDAAGIQTLLRAVDRDILGRALKGAAEPVREIFLANMSSRASRNLTDEMEALGPIRVKDIEEAQARVVVAAKGLIAKGEIRMPKGAGGDDEELVG